MHRSPTRTFVRPPRAALLAPGFVMWVVLAGTACDPAAQPGEGSQGLGGTGDAPGQQPGSAGAGAADGAAGAGGSLGGPVQALPDPTGKIDPRLLADATVNRPHEVVVMLDQQAAATLAVDQALASATDPNQIALLTARLNAVKDQLLDRLRAQPIVALNRLQTLPAMHVRVDSTDALMALAADSSVGKIVMNDEHQLLDSTPVDLTLINQPQAAAAGKLGAGVAVAVLDTGTDYKRAPFNCSAAGAAGCPVVYAQDFAPSDGNVDDNGHGTNVSGIVLSVAPSAKIIALDVFNGATAWTTDIMSAIDWVIQNKAKYNIVSINMSLGGGASTTTCPSDPLAISVASARAAGILSAVASGNAGSLNALSSPACGPDAVSVGAVHAANLGAIGWSNCSDTTTAADKVACFSCSSSFLTILAPGVMITAAGITMSGTSQATPHVAGAIAVLASAFPSESPTDRVTRLTSYGAPVRDARNGITKPRLDLMASLNGAASPAPTTPTTPTTPAAPAGTIALNAKASYTKTTAVTATLAVTSGTATQVCLSEATTCTAWVTAAASKSVTLSKGDGTKTVRAWWKDAKGNISASPASASIVLDTAPPANGTITASATELTATFTWSGFTDAGSGMAGYRVVTGSSSPAAGCSGTAAYEGTATTFTKSLTAGTIYARVCGKDAVGNVSAGAVTTIVLKAGTHTVSLAAPTTTSAVGNSAGGTATTDTCPAGQALVGFAGSLSAGTTAGVHRQIKGICGTLSVTGTTASVGVGTTMITRGQSGASAWSRMCPANQVVVSFSGRSGLLVDQLTFACARLTAAAPAVGSALTAGAASSLSPVGGTGGTAFAAMKCGAGQIANAMIVRTGDNLDAFALACSKASVGN